MRRVSLNFRLAQYEESTAEIYVVLFYIMHELLDAPVRLSTDNGSRISDDPIMYATRSTWMGSNPLTQPFLWVLASSLLPDDKDDAPATGNIVLENVDNDIAKTLRSFTTPPTIHMAVVLASSPNNIEAEFRDLTITSAEINVGEVKLEFSRDDIEMERYPADRFSKNRYPGLHR